MSYLERFVVRGMAILEDRGHLPAASTLPNFFGEETGTTSTWL